MITRSKLVEQLRDYQIRSQQKWVALTFFSPKPQINSRADVVVALSWALLCCLHVVSSYVAVYFRHFRLSAGIVFLGICIPICLRISRHRALARKRERGLPLSM